MRLLPRHFVSPTPAMRDNAPVSPTQRPSWHFMVTDDVARDAAEWDPDQEPQRFASGIGHNVLELYARLRKRGLPVTAGATIPPDSTLVIYFQHAFARFAELPVALRAAPFHTAVIRSDAPLWWWPLLPADLVVVPNEAPVWRERLGPVARHLPALSQRGMVPRDPSRVGVRTVTFKGNPESVPGYVREPGFRAALEQRGIELLIDTPVSTDGGEQRWHDFQESDVVLCLRGAAVDDPLTNKPATRLINAWCAGTIPLVGPEPAYLELVRDGVDGFVVSGSQDILRVMDRLAADEGLAQSVYAACRARGGEFRAEVLLDRWVSTLGGASGPRRGWMAVAARRGLVLGRAAEVVSRAVLRRARYRLGRLLGRR